MPPVIESGNNGSNDRLHNPSQRTDKYKLLAVIGIGFAPEKDEDPLGWPEDSWYPEPENKQTKANTDRSS